MNNSNAGGQLFIYFFNKMPISEKCMETFNMLSKPHNKQAIDSQLNAMKIFDAAIDGDADGA